MISLVNGTGKCCPVCNCEVELYDIEPFNAYTYKCPECGQLLYPWECGNTVETTEEEIRIQSALDEHFGF